MALLQLGPVLDFADRSKLAMLWATDRDRVTFLFQATEISVGGCSFSRTLCNGIERLPHVIWAQITDPTSDVIGLFNIVFQVKVGCTAIRNCESLTRSWKNKIRSIIRNYERDLGDRCNG